MVTPPGVLCLAQQKDCKNVKYSVVDLAVNQSIYFIQSNERPEVSSLLKSKPFHLQQPPISWFEILGLFRVFSPNITKFSRCMAYSTVKTAKVLQ